MSKAEEAALKVYPQKIEGDSRGSYDLNELNRQKFLLGYCQAEKDLELTWENMFDIFRLVNAVLDDYAEGKTRKEIGEEVLRRFKISNKR